MSAGPYTASADGLTCGVSTPPKMHKAETKKYFPEAIRRYLFDDGGYDRAYRLLANDPDALLDQPYPANGSVSSQVVDNVDQVIKALNTGTGKWGCSFASCALAAEFISRTPPDQHLYQFSMGAFSTVNWILNRVFNRDECLTVLPRTQVMTATRNRGRVESLTVRDGLGVETNIPVGRATVILSAGTIGSAAIALRSGIGNDVAGDGNLAGKGLMDHDIWGTRFEILQGEITSGLNGQPLKLQSWVRFDPDGDYVLLNVHGQCQHIPRPDAGGAVPDDLPGRDPQAYAQGRFHGCARTQSQRYRRRRRRERGESYRSGCLRILRPPRRQEQGFEPTRAGLNVADSSSRRQLAISSCHGGLAQAIGTVLAARIFPRQDDDQLGVEGAKVRPSPNSRLASRRPLLQQPGALLHQLDLSDHVCLQNEQGFPGSLPLQPWDGHWIAVVALADPY